MNTSSPFFHPVHLPSFLPFSFYETSVRPFLLKKGTGDLDNYTWVNKKEGTTKFSLSEWFPIS